MVEFNENMFKHDRKDKFEHGLYTRDEVLGSPVPHQDRLKDTKNLSRVKTGLNRLDELLAGGLPNRSITLVSGTPGSGKTILCFNFIWEGLKNGERCLYLTSDERVENILKQASELGFDFKTYMNSGNLKIMYLDLDKADIHQEMETEVSSGNYSRVILDSLTPVSEIPVWLSSVQERIPMEGEVETKRYPAGSIASTRMHVKKIISILSRDNCTAMITSEVPEGSRSLSRDTVSEFLVDGIILMDLDPTMDRRKLTVRKMRATKHTLKPHDIQITEGGIKFL